MRDLFIFIFIIFSRILIKTLRYKVIGLERFLDIKNQGGRVVFAIWHGQLALFFPIAYYTKVCGIVSKSKDGEIAARVIKKFGFDSIRGSSSRSGAIAIIEAEKYLEKNYDIVITVDGPKGPKFDVKSGAVYISKRFNCTIIPAVANVDRYKSFGSWDNFLFPLPFAKIHIYLGEPIVFNSSVKREDIKDDTEKLKMKMNEMTREYAEFYL